MDIRTVSVEKELTIHAYDIDAMGIVSNIVYVRWFEDLRTDFLKMTYPLEEMLKTKISPILMHTEVDYQVPLTIFDKPIARCWLSSMGNSSWEMTFEITVGDKIHCKGKQNGCFYDLLKKRVTRIPDPLRKAIMGEK